MSSFQDLRVFLLQLNPKEESLRSFAQAMINYKTERERERMRVTPLGLCLRVIVNEKSLNLEKTTLSFLSLLIFIFGDILAF